jgi:hypothetical protein
LQQSPPPQRVTISAVVLDGGVCDNEIDADSNGLRLTVMRQFSLITEYFVNHKRQARMPEAEASSVLVRVTTSTHGVRSARRDGTKRDDAHGRDDK